jgi:anti-anti-sigma factor
MRRQVLTMPGVSSFTVQAAFRGDTSEVTVRGDVDVTTSPQLEEMLALALDKHPRRLVIDLTAVGYLDCSAARVIRRAARALPEGQLTIRRPGPLAGRLLQLTGLTGLIEDDAPARAGRWNWPGPVTLREGSPECLGRLPPVRGTTAAAVGASPGRHRGFTGVSRNARSGDGRGRA